MESLQNTNYNVVTTSISGALDIRDYPEIVETLNAIINNKGAAEIKLEGNGLRIVVVEVARKVKKTHPVK